MERNMQKQTPRRCEQVVSTMEYFLNRQEAGQDLARDLQHYAGRSNVVVLALPRGGVPVAYEIAQALRAPLDVMIVRKLGVPGHEELAMGAIASGGVRVLHDPVIQDLSLSEREIDRVTRGEERELLRREQAYRGHRPSLPIEGRVVVLVDDGLATGSTMRAAIAAVRQRRPARIVVAVPVASHEVCEELRDEADEVHCTITPPIFFGVGQWYEDFSQTTDEEVRQLLHRAPAPRRWTYATSVLWIILYSGLGMVVGPPALAADMPCRFKAESETTEIHVLVNGKTQWAGTIEKHQTRTISIPEGAFTVISKIYNPNLRMKEDVRTDAHTRQCRDQAALNVPLFPEPQER
jgi:putative phosphoribosyl transferase